MLEKITKYISDEVVSREPFEQVPTIGENIEYREFTFTPSKVFCSNKVSHQKYTFYNLIPKFLFLQFRFFFNFFYLVITLSQLIPAFRVGFLVTYISPLIFVLSISFMKEMWDEYQVMKRDYELNSKKYSVLDSENRVIKVKSQDLLVGNVIEIEAGERVPADLILLKTSNENGSAFIKTDQLDGETDWKLRRSLGVTQSNEDFRSHNIKFEIEQPRANIYDFNGRIIFDKEVHPISIESTVWCNTVVANGKITGVICYTGTETRSSLNTVPSAIKIDRFEKEMNQYSGVLFGLLFVTSFLIAASNGITSNFPILLVRFVLLFSYIIPISMRVNLDMSKLIFAQRISKDKKIEGAILRNSNLPEELGRIQFLFSDKTGTLTQNEMEFKKLQYDNIIADVNCKVPPHPLSFLALALCNSVSVTLEGFQASSPDEIALVKHVAKIGYKLIHRTDEYIEIEFNGGQIEKFNILAILPFSSIWSHMGIVLSNEKYGNLLLIKGSDAAVSKMVKPCEWLDEVVGNLAREGLRTLVFSSKRINSDELNVFLENYHDASSSIMKRSEKILESFQRISKDMELIGVTGVEDKLQENVPETLEALEAAQIKVWMLTGDKMETAICVARSSRLFSRDSEYAIINSLSDLVKYMDKPYIPELVIDGRAIQVSILPEFFIDIAMKSPAVVVYRCSPSQKEKVVKSIMKYKDVVTCAIGDGGNDVSMIQASSIGIGIVGKEGKQASLSADVSINSFSHIQRLFFWHGSNCYRHSSRLAQFVMHRGIIMTTIQAIYSLLFNFTPSPLYNDWLTMGFATYLTSFPVFSLIFDWFIDESTVMEFPELYIKCQKGFYFSPKTFIEWVWLAIYQGSLTTYVTISEFGFKGIDERHIQSISFTSLILTELCLIAIELNHFNFLSITAELSSLGIYIITMLLLPEVFDFSFILSTDFIVKILFLTVLCILPLIIRTLYKKRFNPDNEVFLQYSEGKKYFFI